MLTLQTFPPGFGQPSLSPFCVKAMALLSMSGLQWQPHETLDPRKAPMGKLPVLIDGSDVIADSSAIRTHLEAISGKNFDAGLSEAERAQAHIIVRMVENHLNFHLVADRWMRDEGWAALRAVAFADLPPIVRGIVPNMVRKRIIGVLLGQGVGRFNETERLERARADLEAINVILGTKPFLFGDAPTSADSSVAAFLAAILATPITSPLAESVRSIGALAAYTDRAMDRFFAKGADA